ncbi:hypothetical protein [Brevibacillus agri]|uniref:hypothetical protein n=1 Tax=Brevibacillus agri TaxID=51101 RepID=UPI0024C09388|nr:hypothetical protein [Brevibacillus agri]MED4569514.1 hypothetical protein [Brevibacillus agri]WHX32131.1 hypothetical protein QNK09_07990 [Brevibacillus agri]
MLFLMMAGLVVALVLFFLKRIRARNYYSAVTLVLLFASVLSTVCLAQNYTESLIPAANDGIAISNSLAYWIIGEDRWSRELFKSYFDGSVYVSLLLLLLYLGCVIQEKRHAQK